MFKPTSLENHIMRKEIPEKQFHKNTSALLFSTKLGVSHHELKKFKLIKWNLLVKWIPREERE